MQTQRCFQHLSAVSFIRQFAALGLIATVLSSCSSQKTITTDQFDSDLRTALSLCAESQLFVEYVQEGKSTDAFRRGHVEYLEQLATDQLREAEQAAPDKAIETSFRVYVEQLRALSDQLQLLKTTKPQQVAFLKIRTNIAAIERALQQVGSSS